MRNHCTLALYVAALFLGVTACQPTQTTYEPETDWGTWRLGHRNDIEFLQQNRFTVTFLGGAPQFEDVTRAEFDDQVASARAHISRYQKDGYLVLRYMTSSLRGDSGTNEAEPNASQLELSNFYHNGGWENYEDYIGAKPDAEHEPSTWVMVRPDGTFPHYRYAPYGRETTGRFETWGCPNNPHFRQFLKGRIRAQAETGLDGVYLDWTQVAGGTCYCTHCRSEFQSFLGSHLPVAAARRKYGIADYESAEPPLSDADPFWMEWIEFRAHTLAGFHRELRSEARKYNPTFLISGNVYGGFGYGPIAYDAAGHMELFGLDGGHDFFYSEIQEFLDTAPHKNADGVKVTNSPALKYLSAAAQGRPVIVYATEITPPIFPDPTEECLNAMALINIAESVANQAIFREKRETPEWATKMYRFLSEQQESFAGARLYSSTAVVGSIHQYLADRQSYAFSMSRVLTDRGIGHVFLVEEDLVRKDLSDYSSIILPQLPLLSAEKQERLLEYVRQGGVLMVLGKTGLFDQHNVPISSPPLATAIGSGFERNIPVHAELGDGVVYFVPVPELDHRYLISAKESGEFTTFGPTLADRFADIPEGYTRGRMHPDLLTILEDAADQLKEAQPLGSYLTSDHPYLEFSTMQNPSSDQVIVQLVNYDVTIGGEITPATNVELAIRLPEGRNAKQISYSSNFSPLSTFKPGTDAGPLVSLNFDQVDIYGLAIISLQ